MERFSINNFIAMGELEKEVAESLRNTAIQRAVLKAVESLEDFTAGALAGSIYKMYKILDRQEQRKKYRTILNARTRLLAQGFLMQRGKFLELTAKGEKLLEYWERLEYRLSTPEKWDGKWRILIFDIPEKRKYLREKLRNTLRSIGFKWLQDSGWVYPYDCEDFIALLKADFKIGKDLLYVIGEAVENDRKLRDYFGVYTS
ncbi:MAG: hypothetical protein Q7R88_02680 [bacterium]|nr:hypothetical protein [bacterium]